MAQIPVGINADGQQALLDLMMANRHGLVAGATGTGKTVTLQCIAEQFSQAGVCVFTADVKGDLAGIALASSANPKLNQRILDLNIQNYTPMGNPVVFWDIFGKNGHPLRTTISEMGPLLLARLLNLNDTQQGILNAAFSIADDQGLLLLDIKDLRALLDWMSTNAADLKAKYGNMTSSSLGAIQRNLLTLNDAGGEQFFGEPAFNIDNLFQKDQSGKGMINILDATKLVNDARLYSTFLLWLLSELFEHLPEVGDSDKPKLVFFFDEAHLFFNSAPKALIEKIEQLVRLIRSKGVGVYFVTQTPMDVPDTILSQLGNRVQHALRAFTPKDQKAVKVAAQTFRANPKLDTQTLITELGVGEALVSFLDNAGTPMIVDKIKVYPPSSRIGPLSSQEHLQIVNSSPFKGVYETMLDRESAYEMINKKMEAQKSPKEDYNMPKVPEYKPPKEEKIKRPPGRPRDTVAQVMLKSTARTLGSSLGRQIVRGLLGSIFKGR
ncbi:MAG: helicase HerA-like domain-containing protein [Candidatus Berkiella sp.]